MNEIAIEYLRNACDNRRIAWSVHVLARLQERGIFRKDVVNAILTGEIIEHYPDDMPYPSCLVLGITTKDKPVHVVCGYRDGDITIITAYYPTSNKFYDDNKTRKERK